MTTVTETADTIAARLDAMPLGEIQARHAELIRKGNGNPKDLGDGELEELVQIFATLRRRSSGPPSAKAAKSKGPEGALEDLL